MGVESQYRIRSSNPLNFTQVLMVCSHTRIMIHFETNKVIKSRAWSSVLRNLSLMVLPICIIGLSGRNSIT